MRRKTYIALPLAKLTDSAIADGIRLYRINQELQRRPNRTRRRLVQITPGELIAYRIAAAVVITAITVGVFHWLVEAML